MKSELILTYPPLTTFTTYADALAILLSFDEGKDWAYSHYIQIQVNDIVNRKNNPEDLMAYAPFTASFFVDIDTRKRANVVCDNFWLGGERCPFFNVFEIPNDYINEMPGSFVDFIKRTIDKKIYLYTYVDVSKISNYNTLTTLGHQVLINGYDDDTKKIKFADFLDSGKYTFAICSYEEIEAAYKGISELFLPIVKSVALIQHIGYGAYTFDFSYVKESVHEYLNPNEQVTKRQNNYAESIFKHVDWQLETYMGIDVYDYFPKFIEQELHLGKTTIDDRLFHAMYDHKEMMIKRVEHFVSKGYMTASALSALNEYKTMVRDKALIVRNLVIKYNISPNQKLNNSIYELIAKVKEDERRILPEIFCL